VGVPQMARYLTRDRIAILAALAAPVAVAAILAAVPRELVQHERDPAAGGGDRRSVGDREPGRGRTGGSPRWPGSN
jgi:hypothetical protein